MPSPTPSAPSVEVLPASLLAEAPTVPAAELKNDKYPNRQSSVGKRALMPLVRFVIIFCIGVSATLAWQGYRATDIITSSYPPISGLAPQAEPVPQNAPDVVGLASRRASSPDQQQPNAILLDLDAVRQSIDRIATSIASSQGRMTSSADRMATTQEQIASSADRMAKTQEQIGRSVDRIAASQEQITRSIDQLTADQEQMTREITKLQEIEQSIRSKNSEPSLRPGFASAPRPVPRPVAPSAPKVPRAPPEPTGP